MSFRRMPFQFTTTDPVERQRELEKRFGLPQSSKNMFVDVANLPTGSSLSDCSPRLQHRVPIFMEDSNQPVHSSVDSSASCDKKPNVRVIPIEVEGSDARPTSRLHRAYSGPADGSSKRHNEHFVPHVRDYSPVDRSLGDFPKPAKKSTGPRVHNIPIQVEGAANFKSPKSEKVLKSPKKNAQKLGSSSTLPKHKVKSVDKENEKTVEVVKEQNAEAEKPPTGIELSFKKIGAVMEEFKAYEAGVKEFSGTTKDKQYRYLDEMLTRCMIKLDDIDTFGNDGVKCLRKSAVKTIQASIDLLESKANPVKDIEASTLQEGGQVSTEAEDVKAPSDNEAEMTECQVTESKDDDKQNIAPEVDMLQNDQDLHVAEPDIQNEVPEVEMAEIKESQSQNLSLDAKISEVEMIDTSSKMTVEPDSANEDLLASEKEISSSVPCTSCDATQDVEMKDISDVEDTNVGTTNICDSGELEQSSVLEAPSSTVDVILTPELNTCDAKDKGAEITLPTCDSSCKNTSDETAHIKDSICNDNAELSVPNNSESVSRQNIECDSQEIVHN